MASNIKKGNNRFAAMLTSVVDQGRRFIKAQAPHEPLIERCKLLVSTRGEASGTALARDILDTYELLDAGEKIAFFTDLAERFDPDPDLIRKTAEAYAKSHSTTDFRRLLEASEPGRRELFRRLNQAPDGTASLVRIRADLLSLSKDHQTFARIDLDLELLLKAWFNRGFLDMVPIDWNTPANLLEKISHYEAVHEINSWEELRQRVEPPDRRCYAFFHPRMPDEPLIFVQVALTQEMPAKIGELLATDRQQIEPSKANTAVFYSISNCQLGLRGISFGNFLIKQVANDLRDELPQLKSFVTLSPAPGFRGWLDKNQDDDTLARQLVPQLQDRRWLEDSGLIEKLGQTMKTLAAEYFMHAKRKQNLPYDPVARFHLGNGAILERINIAGDLSARGLDDAYGLMVNYKYDLTKVEENHENYANTGAIVTSKAVSELAKQAERLRRAPA